jgi:hypothetical protein
MIFVVGSYYLAEGLRKRKIIEKERTATRKSATFGETAP